MAIASLISAGSKRVIGRSLIPKFLKLGWTRQQGLNYLKESGVGYRRTTYLKDWSLLSGIAQKVNPLKFVRRDLRPDVNVISLTTDKQDLKYKYTYRVTVFNAETGQLVDILRAFEATTLRTMGEIDEFAHVVIPQEVYIKDFEIMDIQRESITQCNTPKFN